MNQPARTYLSTCSSDSEKNEESKRNRKSLKSKNFESKIVVAICLRHDEYTYVTIVTTLSHVHEEMIRYPSFDLSLIQFEMSS